MRLWPQQHRRQLHCRAGQSPPNGGRLLLAGSFDPNTPTRDCQTPLHLVAFTGHKGCVDPNLPTRDGRTPLHLAAVAGQKAPVLSLLEHGTTIDARDATDESPRVEASCRGRQAIVETLLSKGAAANLRGTVPLR
ncbi:unnamed protein product [Ectocarpus sp. CCAP 1310/34]|nr:unnamed protein product [Ectocarpus sp. CCAP 1310/34]